MSKKSFKGGIGDLLKESFRIVDAEKRAEGSSEELEQAIQRIEQLERKIRIMNEELKKWRTGKLTTELFIDSLKEHGLTYNSRTNNFELVK